MSADCLPILICNTQATCVSAIHAGWRSLADGIVEATMTAINIDPCHLLAWLGPAISQPYFEVGPEVRLRFFEHDKSAQKAFKIKEDGRWLGDIFQ